MSQSVVARLFAAAALFGVSLLAGGCDENSGVGFSVGLPASYGSMELGLSTTEWLGGPSW